MTPKDRADALNQMTDTERYVLLVALAREQPKLFDRLLARRVRPARVIAGTVEQSVPR